jgi:putative redox protein
MATQTSRTVYTGALNFENEVQGHKFLFQGGDHPDAPTPKPVVLACLASCTAVDVVAILDKMKVVYSQLSIDTEGDLTEDYPKYYHTIRLKFNIHISAEHHDKMERAVNLSLEKYCGVYAMLSKAANITYEIAYI